MPGRARRPRALIVCASASHGNTRRVADAMAEELDCDVLTPAEVTPDTPGRFDVVGFGSGIYYERPHPELMALVRGLPAVSGPWAFVFATSGGPELPFWPYTRPLRDELARRGYALAGSFTCRGWDTWLPLLLVGGINRGHPDASDLERARSFARSVKEAWREGRAGSRIEEAIA